MARIRTIKPEFFTSEDIVSLSPLARLLYIALWCEADRDARMVWKPRTFKMRYLPADDCQIEALCQELIGSGLVILYGNGYACVPSFKSHQHINPRESASQLPEPDANATRAPRVGTRQARDLDAQGGREGKGRIDNASGFALFWSAYPKKRAKPAALKAFNAAKVSSELLSTILKDIESRKTGDDDWRKEGGKFVPYPATYLNAKRWEDEADGSGNPEPKPWDGAR
jgi:hypothetical protein